MPLFICENCNNVENTALGFYHSVVMNRATENKRRIWKDESLENKCLCSECTPTEFIDGSKCIKGGKWHGKFDKRKFDPAVDIKEAFFNTNWRDTK